MYLLKWEVHRNSRYS